MFFTPELLARRDSGLGLLWLAATLGSKSAFKKLPKRSVLTADITQLCDLISQPTEPLALRLSSNLMFGVVRVYKVKQDILLTDVTNCVSTLKKVEQDLRTIAAQEGQLQMANPIARPSAVSIIPNPQVACVLDYDALVVDWDEYLNIADTMAESILGIDATEDEDPKSRKKKLSKDNLKDIAEPEIIRKETHTLEEHHEHILSASFDLSFSGTMQDAGLDQSSSQAAQRGYDNFFSDGLDDAGGEYEYGLGDDLARELGWTVSPLNSFRGDERCPELHFDNENQQPNPDLDWGFTTHDRMDVDAEAIGLAQGVNFSRPDSVSKKPKIVKKENRTAALSRSGSRQALSPAISFSRQLLSQENEPLPLRDITTEERNKRNQPDLPKKLKRTRLLLDARTELTDDELKVARAKYLQLQRLQKRELLQKKIEKESVRVIEEIIWGAPKGMHARELVNFWQENFKVQVEIMSGAVILHDEHESRPPKRRKVNPKFIQEDNFQEWAQQDMIAAVDGDTNWDFEIPQDVRMPVNDVGIMRNSSEEPGQARRVSKSGSVISANLAFNLDDVRKGGSGASQRSSLFPWDNAGPSSSGGGIDIVYPIEPVDINLRSEYSNSRRESSLIPSQRGSFAGGLTFSPVVGKGGLQITGEDFEFDVPGDGQQETQKSELNSATLERNSNNFLEYAKMQQRSQDHRLTFDVVVPQSTSTRHVAAAAFYHCLVLATKDLVFLEQIAPYEPFFITINEKSNL